MSETKPALRITCDPVEVPMWEGTNSVFLPGDRHYFVDAAEVPEDEFRSVAEQWYPGVLPIKVGL